MREENRKPPTGLDVRSSVRLLWQKSYRATAPPSRDCCCFARPKKWDSHSRHACMLRLYRPIGKNNDRTEIPGYISVFMWGSDGIYAYMYAYLCEATCITFLFNVRKCEQLASCYSVVQLMVFNQLLAKTALVLAFAVLVCVAEFSMISIAYMYTYSRECHDVSGCIGGELTLTCMYSGA